MAVAIHPLTRDIYFVKSEHRISSLSRGQASVAVVAGTGVATCSWDCEGGDPRDDLGDGGPALDATFRGPASLAFDSGGNLYVADLGNHRVRRVDAATGVVTTVAGTDIAGNGGYSGDGGRAADARLNGPITIVLGPDGSLYIADYHNRRVRRDDPGGDGVVTGAADETIESLVSDYQAWGLPKLGPELFSFTPPKGADVVSD